MARTCGAVTSAVPDWTPGHWSRATGKGPVGSKREFAATQHSTTPGLMLPLQGDGPRRNNSSVQRLPVNRRNR